MLNKKKQKKLKTINVVKNNIYILQLAFQIVPGRVAIQFVSSVISYASWAFFSVVYIRYLINAIEKEQSFKAIILYILIVLGALAATQVLNSWFANRYSELTDQKIFGKLNIMFFDKASSVDLSCYEDPEFYNTYTLAMEDVTLKMTSAIESLSNIAGAFVSMLFVFYSMYQIDHYIVLFVLFPIIGNFVFGRLVNQYTYERDKKNAPNIRKRDYVNRTLYLAENAKEFRLSYIINVILKEYADAYNGMLNIFKEYKNKISLFSILRASFVFTMIFEGIMFYGAYLAIVSKSIRINDFAVLSGAMTAATWMLINLANGLMQAYKNGLYIQNMRTFLDYEPSIKGDDGGIILNENTQIKSIEFKNVVFAYQSQDKPVINNINMVINEGEKIALVGHNGAGKTTLIKLLLRLYDPTEGEIIVNGINIKQYDLKSYRRVFATAFQDYKMFSMSVIENVLMREPLDDSDKNTAIHALRRSGLLKKVESLQYQENTILTREFSDEGVVLSGGEYQKIAAARAFVKPYRVAVFDEPSSALDPIAERELFESILKSGSDKTIIFISHRLSSATLADKVYMLENGNIIESGLHDDLVSQNGEYARMYKMQAEHYVETEFELIEKRFQK